MNPEKQAVGIGHNMPLAAVAALDHSCQTFDWLFKDQFSPRRQALGLWPKVARISS
jgi:hypothetical protein